MPEQSAEIDEIDEQNVAAIQKVITNAALRPHPFADDNCGGCAYYLDDTQEFAYCWHPSVRLLVGKHWWCQWFEETGT
jgi:hypothetical protein